MDDGLLRLASRQSASDASLPPGYGAGSTSQPGSAYLGAVTRETVTQMMVFNPVSAEPKAQRSA